jgi:hypothetical protein
VVAGHTVDDLSKWLEHSWYVFCHNTNTGIHNLNSQFNGQTNKGINMYGFTFRCKFYYI